MKGWNQYQLIIGQKSLHEVNLDQEDLPFEWTLGVLWDVERGLLHIWCQVSGQASNKRGVLSTTSSIYDPLGFASPFVLKSKAIFQELCRVKVDWDEKLPVDIAAQWHRCWTTCLCCQHWQFQDALDQHPLVVCYRPSSITFPMLRNWLMVLFHISGLETPAGWWCQRPDLLQSSQIVYHDWSY